jgi:hypothetical protein
MALVNLGFPRASKFSENYYPQFGHAPSKIFTSPVLGRRMLKNISLKGRQIHSLPGAPAFLGSLLFESQQKQDIFPFSEKSRPALALTKSPLQ